jgi:hypothetical protein
MKVLMNQKYRLKLGDVTDVRYILDNSNTIKLDEDLAEFKKSL